MTTTITHGTESVRISDNSNGNGTRFFSVHIINNDQVVQGRGHSTLKGAQHWARKVLGN